LSRNYAPEQACSRCAGPFGALACTECWEISYNFKRVLALGVLDGSLARAIVLYKDSNERRLADMLGSILGAHIHECWNTWGDAVCWIPATTEALHRRGFDHGQLLGTHVAQRLTLPAVQLLERPQTRRDQRKLNRGQRLMGEQRFHCRRNLGVVPEKILLIDDVFTTGGTAQAATKALLEAGVQTVRLAVLGRAW